MANTIFFVALCVTVASIALLSGIYIHLKRSEPTIGPLS
jgi:hypothetical protein